MEPRELDQVSQIFRVLVCHGPGGVGLHGVDREAGGATQRTVHLDEDPVTLFRHGGLARLRSGSGTTGGR